MSSWVRFAIPGILAFSGVLGFAQETQIQHKGADWSQVFRGLVPVHPSGRVLVTTTGNVRVQGTSDLGRVGYVMTMRVRASSLPEAQRVMAQFVVRSRTQGDTLVLEALVPKSHVQGADLEVSVPVSLRQAVVRSLGGNVTSRDIQGDVRVETAAGQIELDRIGAGAVLRTGGGDIRLGKIGGGVRCASGGGNIAIGSAGQESWFDTAGGDITIQEAGGNLHATTAGGNVRVQRCGGSVFAHTGGGIIEVLQAAGIVVAENSGGAIQVSTAQGVRCESAAGAIRLRNIGSGALRANTAIGSIMAELISGSRMEDSMLSTNAGDITVFFPSNIPVTVQATNETAGGQRIVSDFPEIRIRSVGLLGTVPVSAEGMLNGGGPLLRIVASGGTIYLRRQK